MRAARGSAWALAAGLLGGLAWMRSRRRADLRGATALVTGGSRGLGLLIARELARRGSKLAICARDEHELDEAREELERHADVLAIPCDVADRASVERMVAAVEGRFGAVDVLVNNAGIIQVGPAETLSMRDLHAAMAANFWGMVHATYAVLPSMRGRGNGRIVNITSIGGTVPVPHLLGYTSAKFAAVGFSTGIAAEMARHGVLVSTIVPGLMRTGSFLNALVKGRRDAEANLFSVMASLPLLTIDGRRAARRIVLACERGEPFVTLGIPAKALRLVHALAPGLTIAGFAAVTRFLPGPGDDHVESEPEPGWMHRTGMGDSVLTRLGDEAAAANHERPIRH